MEIALIFACFDNSIKARYLPNTKHDFDFGARRCGKKTIEKRRQHKLTLFYYINIHLKQKFAFVDNSSANLLHFLIESAYATTRASSVPFSSTSPQLNQHILQKFHRYSAEQQSTNRDRNLIQFLPLATSHSPQGSNGTSREKWSKTNNKRESVAVSEEGYGINVMYSPLPRTLPASLLTRRHFWARNLRSHRLSANATCDNKVFNSLPLAHIPPPAAFAKLNPQHERKRNRHRFNELRKTTATASAVCARKRQHELAVSATGWRPTSNVGCLL